MAESELAQRVLVYRCLAGECSAEITEKKSRFIATLRPVETEEDTAAFINEIKKKYFDASHNCSALILGMRGELTRCNDDGEPSGTAGRPMLDVLLGEEVRNTAVVVTRYFGGTLLGTGGLVRAYGTAVKEGLKAGSVLTMRYGSRIRITAEYTDLGRLQYILGKRGLVTDNPVYTQHVAVETQVPEQEVLGLFKELTDAFSGRLKPEVIKRFYFVDNM